MIEATTCNNAEYPHVSLEDMSKFVDEMAGCERKLRRKEKEIWDELSTEDKEVISMRLIRGFKKFLTGLDASENDTSPKYDTGVDPYSQILTGGAEVDTHAGGKIERYYE